MSNLLIALLIAYLAVVGCIVFFQRQLMYHPNTHILSPAEYGLRGFEDMAITEKDGTSLQLWVHHPQEHFPTIVYFHGNAGNLGDRAAKFSAFADSGFGIVALSYRGYGKSGGSPSEAGIYDDARAAVEFTLTKLHVPPGKLIYFGESLGSGVAVQIASERAPALLMLEAAYTSVATRAAELYPFIPLVRQLVRDKYDSLAKIRSVHAPLLMLHGAQDTTIPLAHGRALFDAAREPKSIIVYPEVNHTDYTNEQIVTPLLNAVRQYKLL